MKDLLTLAKDWQIRAILATREAHKLLSVHESSKSRVIILENLLERLSGIPIDIQDYFIEAVSCLENNLLRAAIVLSWAGFFHILSQALYSNYEAIIRSKRQKWIFNDFVELKEKYAEAQIMDVAKEVGSISNATLKIYHGQLSTRNQCAHPTLYRPSINSAIGYVDDMIRQSIKYL
jgi:hypothetical protein